MLYFGGIVVGIMVGKYFGAIWAVVGAFAGLGTAHYLAQVEASQSGEASDHEVSDQTPIGEEENEFWFDDQQDIIGDFDSSGSGINPASGLSGDGFMDVAGNSFGTNSDDSFGSKSSDDF